MSDSGKTIDVAVVTCAKLPNLCETERPLLGAFRDEGLSFEVVAWDDPSYDWSRATCTLVRTPWDYMHRIDEYLAWSERASGVTDLVNSHGIALWNLHKTYMREMRDAGVPVIASEWFAKGEAFDAREVCARIGISETERFTIKPTVGAAARGLRVFAPGEYDAADDYARDLLSREGLICQRFVESVPVDGEVSVMFIGGADPSCVTHAVRKIAKPGDVRVQSDFGGTVHHEELTAELIDVSSKAMACAPEDVAYGRVDLVAEPEGWSVIEMELVEPELFFSSCGDAPRALASWVRERVGR